MEAILKDTNYRKRLGFEWSRALHSLRTGPVIAILLFQAGAWFFVSAKGAGRIYMDMIGILMAVTVIAWVLTSFVQGNYKIVIYGTILLTIGTILQCIFLKEHALKTGTAHPALALQFQYTVALLAAAATGTVYRMWPKIASIRLCRILFGISLGLSVFALLFTKGAGHVRNWLVVKGISVQITELTKVVYILILAGLLGRGEKPGREDIRDVCLVTAVFLGIFVLQGEFGTLLLLLLVFLSVTFLFVEDLRFFAGTLGVIAGGGILISLVGGGLDQLKKTGSILGTNPLAGFYLRNYHKISNRFIYWLHPEKDALGLGYQLLKARESIVLGGWFGTASVTDLPVKSSDLVYPALIQRCGMVFALLVFILFIYLWLEGIRIFVRKKDRYHQVVGAACSFMLFYQTVIIIAGSTGLCPLTGITLPLISSGGSSLVVCFMILSLMISVSGDVPWKGAENHDKETFFKKNQALAGVLSHLRDLSHTLTHKDLRHPAGSIPGSGPGEEESQGKSPRKRIYQGKHTRPGPEGHRLFRKTHG